MRAAARAIAHWGVVAAAGMVAGWLGSGLGMPLPWLLGPLAVSATAALSGWAAPESGKVRRLSQTVIGTAIGHSFSAGVMGALVALIPLMVGMALWSVLMAAICSLLLVRFAGMDRTSALLANMPGGVAEMAFLAQEMGKPTSPMIAVVQTMRLTSMVVLIPFGMALLMGTTGESMALGQGHATIGVETVAILALGLAAGWVLQRIGVKNAFILGALLVSLTDTATGLLHATVPGILVVAAQVSIGLSIGARFRREDIVRLPRVAVVGLLVSLTTSACTLTSAVLVALATGLDPYTLALAGAPAGITEMVLTAGALGLSVPIVASFQILRIFVVNAFAAPITTLWEKAAVLGGRSA
ncbi:AbrB family transcriptional regulator [Spiribacter halobius]|nr:AbrB family transcriptional regulator [Spiribacter halobius]UEX77874.1 AbrB family transcriptional regulator [Spiribacter halobius]